MTADSSPRRPGRGKDKKERQRRSDALPDAQRLQRVQLYLNPALAEFLDAQEKELAALPPLERRRIAVRRKREAAQLLLEANIQRRII